MLLHEATFDDELRGDAEAKKHSTTSEAIGVGMAMGARRIVLTHFSQRYQKLPVLEDMGFMDVKLEKMEETEESDIPIVDPDIEHLATRASQDDSVPQNNSTTKTDSNPSNIVSNEPSSDAEVTSVDSTGSPKSKPKARSSTSADRKSEISRAAIPSTVNDMKVCVAFDYMRVKVKDIAHMEKYGPALLELYQHEVTEDDAEEKISSAQQVSDNIERKGKRKDGSDDEEPPKEGKKKSNEQINRGKSKKRSHNDKGENKQTEERETQSKRGKDQPDSGKGAADTNTILPDAHRIFSAELPVEDPESENSTQGDKFGADVQNTPRIRRYTDSASLKISSVEENAIGVEAQRQEEMNSVLTIRREETGYNENFEPDVESRITEREASTNNPRLKILEHQNQSWVNWVNSEDSSIDPSSPRLGKLELPWVQDLGCLTYPVVRWKPSTTPIVRLTRSGWYSSTKSEKNTKESKSINNSMRSLRPTSTQTNPSHRNASNPRSRKAQTKKQPRSNESTGLEWNLILERLSMRVRDDMNAADRQFRP